MPTKQAVIGLLLKLVQEAQESVNEGNLDLQECQHWHRRAYSTLVLTCDENDSHVIDFFAAGHAYENIDPFRKNAVNEYNLAILASAQHLSHSIEILTLEEDEPQGLTGDRIFIGHGGRSRAWKDLRDFLERTLKLKTDEFDQVPAAGYHATERLQQMLDNACFAFIVMTGEDEVGDSLRARQNVIHEIGLFQGRLGVRRAIIMLEEGCERFSNIDGLIYIPFPKGNIEATAEKVRGVLLREGILAT